MKRSAILTIVLAFLFPIFIAACGGGGGGGSSSPDPTTFSAASRQSYFDSNATCPDGGIAVDTGIDENGNGLLDPDEVDNTEYVCNGDNGLPSLVTISTEDPGGDCAFGGLRIESGLDDNENGILEAPGEVDSTTFVCNEGYVNPVSLGEAVDELALEWTTGGDNAWFATTTPSYWGSDAAQSGSLEDYERSYIQTVVTGPVRGSFTWKVSSEADYDILSFYMDKELISSISGSVDWTTEDVFLPDGSYTLRWEYAKDMMFSAGEDAAWLDSVSFSPITLADALDNEAYAWSTGGDAPWTVVAGTGYTDNDAAQSGSIDHSQSSVLETTVEGPLRVVFDWKVSSENNYDWLTFYVDGVQVDRISGSVDWTTVETDIAEGTHVLKWDYTKDYMVSSGSDRGWVDNVQAFLPLSLGLDNDSQEWTTGGDAVWETVFTGYSGSDSVQSGVIGHDQETWFETDWDGPGIVSFYWKVSSEADWDYLWFSVDGVTVGEVSGEVDWQLFTYAFAGSGTHTLRWTYGKDSMVSEGEDRGWVDAVAIETLTASAPLGEAVDDTTRSWYSTGNSAWSLTTSSSVVDGDSAITGVHSEGDVIRLETTVTGPAEVSFYWKIDATFSDDLNFFVDGSRRDFIYGSADWALYNAFVGPGEHTLAWEFVDNSASTAGSDSAWVDGFTTAPPSPDPALAEAVDDPTGGTWYSYGDAAWFATTDSFFIGSDVAVSGAITHNQSTCIQTEVTTVGDGNVSWYWSVSSEEGYDSLIFYVNGVAELGIDGIYSSSEVYNILASGTYTLTWCYEKDSSTSYNMDRAWLDDFSFNP